MNRPRKKTIIHHESPNGTRCKVGTPGGVCDGRSLRSITPKIIITGVRKSIPLCAHHQASCEMLKRLQIEAAAR